MQHLLRRTAELLFVISALCGGMFACEGTTQTESETHFLSLCDGDCPDGLTCLCGVCTAPCSDADACSDLAASATCRTGDSACLGSSAGSCDVACQTDGECRSLRSSLACVGGWCRPETSSPTDAGAGGSGSGGTASGTGGSSSGGAFATGGGSASGGAAASGGAGGSSGSACSRPGDPCCDPFPGDGPNYCDDGLVCGAFNRCGRPDVDCDCMLGAYVPVCGTDGQTYDATCGLECVPAAIACDGECPCQCTPDNAAGCSTLESDGGTPCCDGLQCCQGVPYDPAGECHTECNLVSDRGAKTDVRAADTHALLESVARLPISTWRYRSEPGAQHVGPMAQDFAAEFGLGDSDRVIAAVDASGVALASIQALHAVLTRVSRENDALRARVEALESARKR